MGRKVTMTRRASLRMERRATVRDKRAARAARERQITVRGVDDALDRLLKEEAERMSTSVNQTALRLLRRSLGLEPSPPPSGHDDLDALAGTWSAEEGRAFDEELRLQRRVDPKLWKK
jgi:hypothetical protein